MSTSSATREPSTDQRPLSALTLRFYAAALGGDADGMCELLHPDIELHVPGTHALSGDHVGAEAFLAFTAASAAITGPTQNTELFDLMEGTNHVAAYCRVTADRPDRPDVAPLDNLTVHLVRFEDGLIRDVRFHNWDDAGSDRVLELTMGSICLSHEITIVAPASRAWSLLTDYRRDPDWRTGVLSMVPTPDDHVKVGTTTVERIHVAGRTYVNEGEVTSLSPGRRFEWRTTKGVDASGARAVRELDDHRCQVRLELTVRPSGFDRLLSPVLGRMLGRNLRRDLARLAMLAEAI